MVVELCHLVDDLVSASNLGFDDLVYNKFCYLCNNCDSDVLEFDSQLIFYSSLSLFQKELSLPRRGSL